MTLANAKVLHKHFLEIGRVAEAKQLEARFSELKDGQKNNEERQPEEKKPEQANKEQPPKDKEKLADSNQFKKKKK